MEGDEKAGEQAAHLSETLLEIVTIRDKEISQIININHFGSGGLAALWRFRLDRNIRKGINLHSGLPKT